MATGGICFHLPSVGQQFPDVHVLLGQDFFLLLISLGCTEPGRLAKSPNRPHTGTRETAEVPATAAGHTVRRQAPCLCPAARDHRERRKGGNRACKGEKRGGHLVLATRAPTTRRPLPRRLATASNRAGPAPYRGADRATQCTVAKQTAQCE